MENQEADSDQPLEEAIAEKEEEPKPETNTERLEELETWQSEVNRKLDLLIERTAPAPEPEPEPEADVTAVVVEQPAPPKKTNKRDRRLKFR